MCFRLSAWVRANAVSQPPAHQEVSFGNVCASAVSRPPPLQESSQARSVASPGTTAHLARWSCSDSDKRTRPSVASMESDRVQETQREMFSLGGLRAYTVSQLSPPQEFSLGSAC